MLTYLYTLDYDDGDSFQAVAMPVSQGTDDVVADSSLKPEAADNETHHKRMNNVRVYALAEKYGIPELKVLAVTKFEDYEASSNPIHNREVINAVFDSTPDTDFGLRDVVIYMSAKASDVEKNLKEEELAPLIRENGSFGLGMLREVVKREVECKLEQQNQVHNEAWAGNIPSGVEPASAANESIHRVIMDLLAENQLRIEMLLSQ